MLPVALFMLGVFSFCGLLIWLDYRSLGRQKISAEDAGRFAARALARWKISGDVMARSQVTERRARLERLKQMFYRNMKLALYCDAGVAVFFVGIFFINIYQRHPINGELIYAVVVGTLGFSAIFTGLLVGTTGILAFDVLGFRIVKTLVGIYDRTPAEVSVARDGILFYPGGLQNFNYPVYLVEFVRGDVSVVCVHTARGARAQDHYIPIPPGLEAEAETAVGKMSRGY